MTIMVRQCVNIAFRILDKMAVISRVFLCCVNMQT